MATETRRPLAWDILNDVTRKLKTGAAEQAERLSRDTADRQSSRAERAWWSQR